MMIKTSNLIFLTKKNKIKVTMNSRIKRIQKVYIQSRIINVIAQYMNCAGIDKICQKIVK